MSKYNVSVNFRFVSVLYLKNKKNVRNLPATWTPDRGSLSPPLNRRSIVWARKYRRSYDAHQLKRVTYNENSANLTRSRNINKWADRFMYVTCCTHVTVASAATSPRNRVPVTVTRESIFCLLLLSWLWLSRPCRSTNLPSYFPIQC
jgi:hypothetical protein